MKYFNREEIERIGRSGSCMLAEVGKPTAFRYLSSYWLYVEDRDEAFSPHGPSGFWEAWVTLWLSRQFDDNDIFLDVGANVGYYTIMAAKHGIETWAFEPNPVVADLLEQSVALNRIPENMVRVHRQALGEDFGTATLNVPERHSGGAYLTPGEEVVVRPLDGLGLSKGEKVLIKIDAEGYEPKIWAGAKNTLEICQVTTCLEWDSSRWENNGEEFAQELMKQPYVALLEGDGNERQFMHYSQLQDLQGLQTVLVRNY